MPRVGAQMTNKKAGRTRLFHFGEAIYCGFLGAAGVVGLPVVAFGGVAGFLRSDGVAPRIAATNRSCKTACDENWSRDLPIDLSSSLKRRDGVG